ncbi:MAG: SET domain-containing protein [Patescibacteria group bacterium]|nr:SET domain-containing protein [Patescibacteria group bacterium]
MLLINASVRPSSIHGLGLFANKAIPEGTRIWQYSPGLDAEIDPAHFEKLSQRGKDFILFYGFLSRKSGNYHLSYDNVRFINHAEQGNVTVDTSVDDVEYPLIAARDIQAGEELTQNYYDFDNNHQL